MALLRSQLLRREFAAAVANNDTDATLTDRFAVFFRPARRGVVVAGEPLRLQVFASYLEDAHQTERAAARVMRAIRRAER